MVRTTVDRIEVVSVVGFAGDRTDAGMQSVGPLSDELSLHLDVPYTELEQSMRAGLADGWKEVLAEGKYTFDMARDGLDAVYGRGRVPVLVTARCALSVATVPVALRHHPDAVVVWFDAHGDLNTPETSGSGYLGGMPVAAALGRWESGYGAGLKPENLVLAGARALDAAEVSYITDNQVACYKPGEGVERWQEIMAFAAGRPVYIHIDVDAFDPEVLPGEYVEPNGLMKAEVVEMLSHLSTQTQVIGVEIAEFEPPSTLDLVRGSIVLVECMRALFD